MEDAIIPKTKFGGMYTANPETKNHPAFAWLAWNVRITGESVQPIKGYRIFGNEISVAGEKVRDSINFILREGDEIPIRVRDDKTNNVLEFYSSNNKHWETLLKMTKGLNTALKPYNTSTENQLFINNNTDNYSVWSGLKTYLTAAVSVADTDIPVNSTTGFGATGTIIYNGTEIAYTSKTATTFVVASAHASRGSEDGVAEAVDDSTYSAVPKSDVMDTGQNRMWVKSDKTAVEYSEEGDATSWTPGDNRADSGVEDFPIEGGSITGIKAHDQYMFFFKERTVIMFWWEYTTDTVKKIPRFKHITVGENMGAINHKGIASIVNEIYYTSKHGIRSVNKLLQATGEWAADKITDIIAPSIKDYDFSEASTIYYDKEHVFICACKSNSDQANNNRWIMVWFYRDAEGRQRTGISISDIPADCFFVYNNKLYFGSSMDGNVYEMFSGHSRNGAGFQSYYTNNRDDYGKKNIKHADYYIMEGLIWPGSKIENKIFFDGGRGGTQKVDIKWDDPCVSNGNLNTMGANKLGEEIIGGLKNENSGARPFQKVIELQEKNFFDLQIERRMQTAGGYYKIYYEGLVNPEEVHNLTPN